MGDIVALVEEVQKGVDVKAAQQLADKVKSGGGFDLNDFLSQISQMKNMGGLAGLMDKLPSQISAKAAGADMDRAERDVRRMEGIICAMTPLERRWRLAGRSAAHWPRSRSPTCCRCSTP